MDIVAFKQKQSEVMNQLNRELARYVMVQNQYAAWYLADKKGVSTGWLAEAFGVTPQTIYDWIDKIRKEEASIEEKGQLPEEEYVE